MAETMFELINSVRNSGSSATVVAILRVDGVEYPLASVGPRHFVLRQAQDIPIHSRAVVEINVDGDAFAWNIILNHGASPFESRVEFQRSRQRRL